MSEIKDENNKELKESKSAQEQEQAKPKVFGAEDILVENADAENNSNADGSGSVETSAEKTNDASSDNMSDLEIASKKIFEYEDLIKRQQAEFDNFRKRSFKEKLEASDMGKAEVLKHCIPVMDQFKQALAVSKEDKQFASFLKGFEMIYQELKKFLKSQEVETFGCSGDLFDPQKHQAIQIEEAPSVTGEVLGEVYQEGYRLGEKILRLASVKVLRGDTQTDVSSNNNKDEKESKEKK